MATEDFKRKLAAVFSADAAGYSRLMADDEAGTVKTIASYREVMASLIQQHRGRVVDSPGDNVLAEFPSVVDAVQCAVAVQKELQARNAELPENRRMNFRIGINLGDVIEEDERIYGDGVNIAARLEALAEPGGICVSGFVYDQVKNRLKLEYKFIGEKTVKNIKEPLLVYHVLSSLIATEHLEPASEERMAYPLPDKPSIAVLPFDNMSDDPKQEYFCDGITEEIITALSKNPGLFVIARNSTFTYKGKPVKVQQVSEDLGVRYIIEGSVRKADDRIRITAQLIDAMTGKHLWAERFDRKLEDIFAVQDEITINIIEAMALKVTGRERVREVSKHPKNLDAYLKVLEGVYYLSQQNPSDLIEAKKLFEEAIAMDSEYVTPYALLGICHFSEVMHGVTKSPQKSITEASKLAQKALALDESNPVVHRLFGFVYWGSYQFDEAESAFERAVELNPNDSMSLLYLGFSMGRTGKPQEAIAIYNRILRIDPLAPTMVYHGLGNANASMKNYEQAISYYKKLLEIKPRYVLAMPGLTSCYIALGREEEAHAMAGEILKLNPKFSVDKYVKMFGVKDQAENECLRAALLKAGLPE